MRRPAALDAPSNLGLRPPAEGTVPGCYKLAGALRDCGLLPRLAAEDAGCVTPPRYDRSGWEPGDGVFNAGAIAGYSRRLADRVGNLLDGGHFPLVLGGDCSILLGTGLALRRRGRYGVAFLDGHTDFRHPGNSAGVGAAAGEDLALVTGRGQPDLTDLEGLRPYVLDEDIAVLGVRDDDTFISELHGLQVPGVAGGRAASRGPGRRGARRVRHLERAESDGFWIHLDADILDPAVMPAVDSPDPGGLGHDELAALLAPLVASPHCVGLQVTIFDPDLDPDGRFARDLAGTLVAALGPAFS